MDDEQISRRHFFGRSITGSLAAGLAWTSSPPEIKAFAQGSGSKVVALEVHGDVKQGFYVVILFNGSPVARHNDGGEFSAFFQNGDRDLEERVVNWKATSWMGDAKRVRLQGECRLINFSQSKETSPVQATIFAQVNYAVVTPEVVRKEIRLRQSDMYSLYYQVSNRLEPVVPPQKFWSFDQSDHQGGAVREYYPVAGFRTENGLTVGLLTDSGFRNQWIRMIRTDGIPVKPSPRRIPDVSLYEVCEPTERAKGKFFVQQTFGGSLQQTGEENQAADVPLPPVSSWSRRGKATMEQKNGATILSSRSSGDGVVIPFPLKGGEVYSVRLE